MVACKTTQLITSKSRENFCSGFNMVSGISICKYFSLNYNLGLDVS